MSKGNRAWITKEADSATYVRPMPANHRLLGGHLLRKSFVQTAHQWVVLERFLVKLDTPLGCTSTEKYLVLLHTCTVIKEDNKPV